MNLEEARAGVASVAAQIRLEEALRSAKVGDAFRTAGGWKASVAGYANEEYRQGDRLGLYMSGPKEILAKHPHNCPDTKYETFWVGFDGRNVCWYAPGRYHCHKSGAQFDIVAPWPGPEDIPKDFADTGDFRDPLPGENFLRSDWAKVDDSTGHVREACVGQEHWQGGRRHILGRKGGRPAETQAAHTVTKEFAQSIEQARTDCANGKGLAMDSGMSMEEAAKKVREVAAEIMGKPKAEECPACGAYWDVALESGGPGCRHANACPYWAAYLSARHGCPPAKKYRTCKEYADAHWREYMEAAAGADRQGQSHASGRQTSASRVEAPQPEKAPQPEQGKNLPASVIWYCDCGFRGAKNDLNSDPSGCLWCPRCGGSGGLIAPPPPVSTDDPWTGAKEPFFSTMPKEERPQATLHARLQEEPEPKCAACDGKGKFFYIFHSVPGETRKIQAAMSSPCPECGRCVGGGG